ncbi:MAG: hypothetical protein H6662_08620 [Ardenticatenaceae bacterium]|nr:hypothetical protein [Ardenticatenaceae bacterium]
MDMQETANILIIGGGVIGVSIAYHLAQRRVGRICAAGAGFAGLLAAPVAPSPVLTG